MSALMHTDGTTARWRIDLLVALKLAGFVHLFSLDSVSRHPTSPSTVRWSFPLCCQRGPETKEPMSKVPALSEWQEVAADYAALEEAFQTCEDTRMLTAILVIKERQSTSKCTPLTRDKHVALLYKVPSLFPSLTLKYIYSTYSIYVDRRKSSRDMRRERQMFNNNRDNEILDITDCSERRG